MAPQGPEDIARENIDRMLEHAGWAVQDMQAVNIFVVGNSEISTATSKGKTSSVHVC
jgi:hypothetical protein